MKNSAKGFTVTELMTALGILAVILIVGIPTLNNWMPTYRLKDAARQIASDMQLARYRAIATNVRHGIYFDGTGDTYELYSDNDDDANFDSGEEEKTVTLKKGHLRSCFTDHKFSPSRDCNCSYSYNNKHERPNSFCNSVGNYRTDKDTISNQWS